MDRKLEGKAKNITISKKCHKWFVSIQVEFEQVSIKHTSTSAIGVDLGVVHIVNTTAPTIRQIKPLDLTKQERKMKYLQRQLARRSKGKKNWQKTKNKIAKTHHHIGNCRKNHLHQISNQLSKNHAMIVLEDLKIANMTKSAKGDAHNHGKNVKQKSGLNRSILKQGWGELIRQIEYKQSWRGGITLKVNPKYTSKTCNKCGHIDKSNRKTQSHFECQKCGHIDNADINAAKNILAAGHAVLACGETVRPDAKRCESMAWYMASSLKQEPAKAIHST